MNLKPTKYNLFNLFGFNKFILILSPKEKKQLLLVFFLMIIASFLEILSLSSIIPLINLFLNQDSVNNNFFSLIINNLQKFFVFKYENILLLIVFLIFVIKGIFLFFYNFYATRTILRIKASISEKLYKYYIRKEYLFHLKNNSALLIRNIESETNILINSYTAPFLSFFLALLTSFFILILLFYYSFFSTLIVFIVFTFFGIFLNFFVKNELKIIGHKRQVYSFESLKNLQQSLGSIKEIKIFKKQKFFLEKFINYNFSMFKLGLKRSVIGIIPKIIYEYIFIAFIIIPIFIANKTGYPLNTLIATLMVYAIASFRIMPALNTLSTEYQRIEFGLPALNLIFNELKNENVSKELNYNNEASRFEFNNEIELKNISFSYPDKNKIILNNLSLIIKKNTSIGILGDNASGKSTLIDLICGFLEPNKGEILVDQKNIYENIDRWQDLIGYVPQNTYLIDNSVKSNIAFGINDNAVKLEKIKELMQLTGLSENLSLETNVGENGKNISGGQKQKIGIARALYKNPDLVILDEANSAMDIDSEKNLNDIIRDNLSEKTLLIISHRLNVLKYCDIVYKLEKGSLTLIDIKNIT
jgi:ABC-type multidrug transport system fused ATPase/permease subunit